MAEFVRSVPVLIFSFFFIFTIKDLFFTQSTAEVNNKEIPLTHLGSNSHASKFMGPTLKILYCYSCGYKNAFEQYSEMLSKKYPDLSIEGGNYPPSGISAWIARLLTVVKMLAIMAIVAGIDIGRYMGTNTPSWWQWCLTNKFYACIMIFLVCNMFEGQLVSTGAFEISFNDVPVWSKIETGRIPQPPELFQIIDNHLKFQTTEYDINL